MAKVGFLHTAAVHVQTFETLVGYEVGAAAAAEASCAHVVDAGLLDLARRCGVTPEVEDRALEGLQRLVDDGASIVVCTCSTLGPVAESLADRLPVPVVRVDRPMAQRAVRAGDRVAVVAALESTLAPTRGLLEDEARRAHRTVSITETLVPGAWEAFEAGDIDRYHHLVAVCARSLAAEADVIVLAQASMLGAVDLLTDLEVPVLASPPLAVRHALETLTSR